MTEVYGYFSTVIFEDWPQWTYETKPAPTADETPDFAEIGDDAPDDGEEPETPAEPPADDEVPE